MIDSTWQKLWQRGRKEEYRAEIIPKISDCFQGANYCGLSNGFYVKTERKNGSHPLYTWFVPSADADVPLLLYLPGNDRIDLFPVEGYTIAAVSAPEMLAHKSFEEAILDILCVVRWAFREKMSANRLVVVGNALGAQIAAVLQKYTIACCVYQPCLTMPFSTLMKTSSALTMPVMACCDNCSREIVNGPDLYWYHSLPLKGFNRFILIKAREYSAAIADFLTGIPENANPMLGRNPHHIPELSKEARRALLKRYWQIKPFFREMVHQTGSAAITYYIRQQQRKAYPAERIFVCLDEIFCADEACIQELIDLLYCSGIYAVAEWDSKICYLYCEEAPAVR